MSQEQIGGLQVPVDDALVVGHRNGLRGIDDDADRLLSRKGSTLPDVVGERLAPEELHDVVRQPVLDPEVEDLRQARVADGGGNAGLLLEPGDELRVARQRGQEHLDGVRLVEGELNAPIHGAHGALAKDALESVPPADHLADQGAGVELDLGRAGDRSARAISGDGGVAAAAAAPTFAAGVGQHRLTTGAAARRLNFGCHHRFLPRPF